MYPAHRLDTPPPPSQFRRPWSPDPFDPLPSVTRTQQRQLDTDPYSGHYDIGYHAQQRRETSDVSVEALDLADYAMTLGSQQHRFQSYSPYDSDYPPFRPHDAYPPSPPPLRPFASRDSLSPPSLVPASTGSTSSQSHSPLRRPFSLPPLSRAHLSPDSSFSRLPRIFQQQQQQQHNSFLPNQKQSQDEIDIAAFPAWSRSWYNHQKNNNIVPRTKDPDIDMDTAPEIYSAHSLPNHDTALSPFDPSFPTHKYQNTPYAYSPPSNVSNNPYSHSFPSNDSSRTLLPWSQEPPEYGPPVDDEMKEERMRMLEREFGTDNNDGKVEAEGAENRVGSVDEKGNLVTQGPRKRLATRWMQILLALGAAVASVYGAVVTKPPTPAPPAHEPSTYILYVLSFLTFLFLVYLFVFRPCCCAGPRSKKDSSPGMGPFGPMVLPVQQLPGGKKPKGGKKGGKKGKNGGGQSTGDVQVNLIVDPRMFMPGGHADEEDDSEDESASTYSLSTGRGKRRPRKKRPKRMSVFEGLAMEERWRAARGWLKKVCFFDLGLLVVWAAEFGYVMYGARCPSGSYEGWCDSYNVATACACLLAFAFALSLFFDVKDLHNSRQSPRTRT